MFPNCWLFDENLPANNYIWVSGILIHVLTKKPTIITLWERLEKSQR